MPPSAAVPGGRGAHGVHRGGRWGGAAALCPDRAGGADTLPKQHRGIVGAGAWSALASATGASVKVSVTLSVTARQLPLPVVVSVSVTLPAAISAAVGV